MNEKIDAEQYANRKGRELLLSKTVEALPYLTHRECMIAAELLDYFKSVGWLEVQ